MDRQRVLAIPVSFVAQVGDNVSEHIDRFFRNVLTYLGFDEHEANVFSKVEHFDLHNPGGNPVDQRITYLRVHNRVVASVLEARTDSNDWHVCFAAYGMSEEETFNCLAIAEMKKLRAANYVMALIDKWVHDGELDPRTTLVDARMLYGDPFTPEEAAAIVEEWRRNFRA